MDKPKGKYLCDEDCNHCTIRGNRQLSLLMNVLYEIYGEEVIAIANGVCPNMTCCADCHVDDMTHIGNCEIYTTANKRVASLCGHHRHIAAARAIMKGVEAYNAAWSEIEANWREGK